MSGLFGDKRLKRYVNPYTRPGYRNPFGNTDMTERDMQRRRYEVLASFVKNRTGDKRPLRDIAAELYYQDEKRKGNI